MDSKLKTFVITAATLNYSKTAEVMNITQPAVTQNIQALEKEYGFNLFSRKGRGLALTFEGEVCLERARSIVKAYEEMEHEAALLANAASGTITIGVPPALYYGVYQDFIADYYRLSPKTKIITKLFNQEVLEKPLEKHNLEKPDIAFMYSANNEPVTTKNLFTDRLVSLTCHKTDEDKEYDILDSQLIMYEGDSTTSSTIAEFLRSQKITSDMLDTLAVTETAQAALNLLSRYASGMPYSSPVVGLFWESMLRNPLALNSNLHEIALSELSKMPLDAPTREYRIEFLKDADKLSKRIAAFAETWFKTTYKPYCYRAYKPRRSHGR